jgi:hypothetical protein
MSDKRRKASRSANPPSRLVCEDVSFAEIEFPRTVTPRLVIRYSEGLSLLVENQAAIPLAAGFITAFRALEKGGAL